MNDHLKLLPKDSGENCDKSQDHHCPKVGSWLARSRVSRFREDHHADIAVPTAPRPENTVSIVSPGAIGNCRVNDPVMTISPAFRLLP